MAVQHFPSLQLHSLILGCAVLLTGCSQAYKVPAGATTASLQTQTQAWQGRLGLQVHDPMAQEQSFSASFHLQGTPESGSLDVFNPLGSQIAQLQWEPDGAHLRQGDRVTTSESLDALVRQSLGTALPVAALFGWLQGQVVAASGWQVDLSRHADGRITAQRYSPPPQATLRVVLHNLD